MTPAPILRLDPLLGERGAREMLRRCQEFGAYTAYAPAAVEEGPGKGLLQRHDAALNFMRTGGPSGRPVAGMPDMANRTNYFRETYAYGADVRLEGVEELRDLPALAEAARAVHGRPVVVPTIVYANLLLPGQELAVYTDVPQFRGVHRHNSPEWLCVVMRHSQLFERYRIPIVTAISYFGDCDGGELVVYEDGPAEAPTLYPVAHDTAIVLDTDTVFHGVAPVSDTGLPARPTLEPGGTLQCSDGHWHVVGKGGAVAISYPAGRVRFSVSWKAHCFADESERLAARDHTDDLTMERALDLLVADLRQRGRLEGPRPADRALALQLIDEYVRFPGAA